MKLNTISMYVYSHDLYQKAKLSFMLRFFNQNMLTSCSCFAFRDDVHIITMHTSKIAPKSLQEKQSIYSVCVAGTVGHLSL